MKQGWKRACVPAGAASALLLTGCLYTSHHFNTGRLLEPGNSAVTLGAGSSATPAYGCPAGTSWDYTDSTGKHCVSYGEAKYDEHGIPVSKQILRDPGISTSKLINASFGYRLGVRGRMGPFAGLELGLHLETPTNPFTGEFDVKLGLPAPKNRPYHHSLSLGWGIGAWADNSYFMEYAASRGFFGRDDLFFNYRATYLASQFADIRKAEDKRRFDNVQRLIHQAALGYKLAVPALPVLPDFLVPEVILTYPLAPVGTESVPDFALDDRGWGFNLGMGWNFR